MVAAASATKADGVDKTSGTTGSPTSSDATDTTGDPSSGDSSVTGAPSPDGRGSMVNVVA